MFYRDSYKIFFWLLSNAIPARLDPHKAEHKVRHMQHIILEPEIGVPFSPKVPYVDLRERALAAIATADALRQAAPELFDDVLPTAEEAKTAASLTLAYAEDPITTSRQATDTALANLTPATLIMTGKILAEFGQAVAENAVQIRHLVTNKLLLESDGPDARIRLRALELLGKITDVALFTEKSEITVTHKSTSELRAQLKGKLEKLVNPTTDDNITDVEFTPIDVDVELGLVKASE